MSIFLIYVYKLKLILSEKHHNSPDPTLQLFGSFSLLTKKETLWLIFVWIVDLQLENAVVLLHGFHLWLEQQCLCCFWFFKFFPSFYFWTPDLALLIGHIIIFASIIMTTIIHYVDCDYKILSTSPSQFF